MLNSDILPIFFSCLLRTPVKSCDLKPDSDLSYSKDHSVVQLSTVNPCQEYIGGRADSDFSCAGRACEPLNAKSNGSCQPLGCLLIIDVDGLLV